MSIGPSVGIVTWEKYVSVSLNEPAAKRWSSATTPFHPKVFPAALCASESGKFTVDSPLTIPERGTLSGIAAGHTDCGNVFLYSS
jgi:hypothetical protein